MTFIRQKLSYANVMSTIAVFLVLGGATAVAANELIKKNSVGTKQLKAGAVTTKKIRKGAVTAGKLAPGLARRLGPQGPVGPRGPQGVQGPPGLQGEQGNANVTTYSLGGHNFAASSTFPGTIPGVSAAEMADGAWYVQLVRPTGNLYPVPGPGLNGDSTYRVHISGGADASLRINLLSGPGEAYADIRLTRIAASDLVELGP